MPPLSYAQYAALPYAVVDGELRILLVTSQESGRWIIPKGWPEKRKEPHEQAAREAFEEAGAIGHIAKEPFGSYSYMKRTSKGLVLCSVDVYLFKVEKELDDWPEKRQRIRRWMSPDEAAASVKEAGLSELLLHLPPPFLPPP